MFWPDQLLKDAVAMLAVMAVVLGVILVPAVRTMLAGDTVDWGHVGAELGAPADPSQPYAAARPEWYFLFLFQFLKVFEGWGATGEFLGAIVVPALIMVVMFLMPIIGNWKLGHRFNIAFTIGLLVGAATLTGLALDEDYYALWANKQKLADASRLLDETGGDEKKLLAAVGGDEKMAAAIAGQFHAVEKLRRSEAFLAAVKTAGADAERAAELAGRPERIPPGGALELVRRDPLSQGPRLFAQHCGSCHSHVDPASPEAKAILAKASAPNLHGFGTAAWVTALLDPGQVAGAAYFGNTAHKEGDMVSFVQGDLQDKDTWKPDDVAAVIAALAAEAGFANPNVQPATIATGRKLIASDERCGGCHRFGDNATDLGTACDLTGWGSRAWVIGIITDPSHERFYGESNDRMPSFGSLPGGGTPRLTDEQIGLIADWLRGDWYRP
jgi:ubiquinol-cytochrome c reductase cytochrome b subunit